MASSRSEVRRCFIRILGFTIVGAVGGFALTTCGGEPPEDIEEPSPGDDEVEMSTQQLSSAQCRYFTNNNQNITRICHYDSKKRRFVGKTVTQSGCCAHTGHSKDYVAAGDRSCTGGGCIPPDAPCDRTKKCCTGSCTNGKCPPPVACLPAAALCVPLGTPACCRTLSCACSDPLDPTNCHCI
jgi:hypothetical protein